MPNFTDTHQDYSDSYESMLDDLDQPETVKVTEWEADFIEAMYHLNEIGRALTDAQAAKIRQLVDKHFG